MVGTSMLDIIKELAQHNGNINGGNKPVVYWR